MWGIGIRLRYKYLRESKTDVFKHGISINFLWNRRQGRDKTCSEGYWSRSIKT